MNQTTTTSISGNGTENMTPEEMNILKTHLTTLTTKEALATYARHRQAEATRFCIWPDQSDDGRIHAADFTTDRQPLPFEGASDARLDLADEIINILVAILMTAVRRADGSFRGMTSKDMAMASQIQTIWRYVKKNQLGAKYYDEVEKAIQWMLGDDPAISVLHACWRQEVGLRPVKVEPPELLGKVAAMVMQSFVPAPVDLEADPLATPDEMTEEQAMAEAQSLLTDTARTEAAIKILMETLAVTKKRARKILTTFRAGETIEYPVKNIRLDQPRIVALRPFETVFFPSMCTGVESAPWVFVREMISEVELRSRVHSMGYDPEFVEDLVGEEGTGKGHSGYAALYMEGRFNRDLGTPAGNSTATQYEELKGLYEVITAYFRASDDDGFPGIYHVTFHSSIDRPATPKTLYAADHGEMPFIILSRERLGDSMYDSRGVPAKLVGDQNAMKISHDAFCDHVQVATLPPILAPQKRPRKDFDISPLGIVREVRPGEVRFMEMPPFPAAAEKFIDHVERRSHRRFGIPHAEVPETIQAVVQQNLVDRVLAAVAQIETMALQLVLQYMPMDTMRAILDMEGDTSISKDQTEIRAMFSLHYDYDARQLDLEWVKEFMTTVGTVILPMDSSSRIDRGELAAWAMSAMDPTAAEKIVREPQAATELEIEDEKRALGLILQGIEPALPKEGGHNARLRLSTLEQIIATSPDVQASLSASEAKRAMVDARMNVYRQTEVQEQNKIIGKRGGDYATEQPQG